MFFRPEDIYSLGLFVQIDRLHITLNQYLMRARLPFSCYLPVMNSVFVEKFSFPVNNVHKNNMLAIFMLLN